MARALPVCAALLALPLVGWAQTPAPTETVIPLKVQPARAAKPALRYQLLPELAEMEPGNAILGYLKCFMEQNQFFFAKESEEKRDKWAEMPLKDLPLKEIRAAGYTKNAPVFRQADYAARLEHADWQTLLPIRREGIELLLPEVQQLRRLAWALAVRFRADVAERKFDDALVTAKTMLALARHLGEHPTIIGDLVGIAIAAMAVRPLEEMLQQPGCPNLYWALTDLPDPFLDLRQGLQGERIFLTKEFAALDERHPMSEAQLQRAVEVISNTIRGLLQHNPHADLPQRGTARWLNAQAADTELVNEARRRLTAYGLPEERVKQFPPLQVVMIDAKLAYETWRDEGTKMMALPYWQVAKLLEAAQPTKSSQGTLFGWAVPTFMKVRQAQARLQMRFGLLRCVEALRLYAAEHDGQLPARLEDVGVPVPLDPFTGQPFRYQRDGTTATVRNTPPAGMENNSAYNVRYVVTITR
jgi:hypothetical protein